MTTYDLMIRAENFLELKFSLFADDYITEGYKIDKLSPEFHTAMMEFVADAMTEIAATMVANPRGDGETEEGYIDDIFEEFTDTCMDGYIEEKLQQHFGE